KRSQNERTIETHVSISTASVNFFYGIQVSDGGLEMSNNATVNGNVFSNGSIVGLSGTTITGDAIVAGGIPANPAVEWTTHDTDHVFATASTNRDITQSFTATAGGALSKMSVYLAKAGSPSSNLTVRITTDNGGKPNSSDIANTTIAPSQVGASASWIDVSFSSPPTLTNGTKYWIVLDYGTNSASNYWIWRKDTSDAYAGNTGQYTSNWSSGSATWTNVGGDLAFRVWIGGTTTRIEGVTIGNVSTGTGRANLFVNTSIHGSSCLNAYCIVENPARAELPISDGVISDWKDAAAAGGTCGPPTCDASGNYKLTNGASGSLGPIKINGNFELDNNAIFTMNGTIWVVGEIKLSNNCTFKLNPGYGSFSGGIITDGKAAISNNCVFQGSGNPASYVLLLSTKNSLLEEIITVDNNSVGVVYYAGKGRIKFSNNATAKEATAYGITLDNNAEITYESGLS
ncbi:MAG: choice-of-anchor R domain-containing protein, partial [Patescibacteria group bacterium]